MKRSLMWIVGLIAFLPCLALAELCDYKPSSLIGAGATGAGAALAGATAAAGGGLKAAGFYTFTHAVTGATMLGSTAGGASAAGTVGIMGGTAGAVGTVAAFLMSPVVIATGAVVAVGAIAVEGTCYLVDKDGAKEPASK